MNSYMKDIVNRTNGELYIGVVGSVRSGKSTFIRKFMEMKVLPFVLDDNKNKIIDELPQSAQGKGIMTVEPKFVPSNPASISINDEIKLEVRLVDCVGFVISNAKGYINDDGTYKLVKTPWFNDDIPFKDAASIGTKKVMENHSHIGLVFTSDGSFGEFNREDYANVEDELVEEMKKQDKPFVIIINTKEPNSDQTKQLINNLESKYNVKTLGIDVLNLTDNDIDRIIKESLNEFNINKIDINVPNWLSNLADSNEYKINFTNKINEVTGKYRKFKDVMNIKSRLDDFDMFERVTIDSLDSGSGNVEITIEMKEELFDDILRSIVGPSIDDRGEFIKYLSEASIAKTEYEKYKYAIESVKTSGYGIALPNIDELILEEPSIIKQGNRYGIKLNAKAPSIHMIKVDVESTFEPIIGSVEQSNSLLESLNDKNKEDKNSIWDSLVFGRKISEVVNDGIKAKLYSVKEDTTIKLRECLEKMINKGKGGIITILL